MEFALPAALADKIITYDPTLKKQKASQRRTSTGSSNRKPVEFPLGNVNDLIPFHIVSKEEQIAAVKHINNQEVPQRFRPFFKLDTISETPVEVTEQKLIAILYHFESAWYAAWLPTEEEKGKYFYGFAIAFRNASKASEKHQTLSLSRDVFSPLECVYHYYDKKEFRVYKHQVTAQNISEDKFHPEMWNLCGVRHYHKKSAQIYKRCVYPFGEKLRKSVPVWKDSYGVWDRVDDRKNTYNQVLKFNFRTSYNFDADFVPSAESILQIFKPIELRSSEELIRTDKSQLSLTVSVETYKVLNTPFFRKWMQEQCDLIVSRFNDPATETRRAVVVGFMRIIDISKWISFICSIWPDTSVDHFQTHLNALLCVRPNSSMFYSISEDSAAKQWLRNHMKVTSLFNIIQKMYEELHKDVEEKVAKQGENSRERIESSKFDSTTELLCVSYYGNTLFDTINMLQKVCEERVDKELPELDPPKRWRLTEFHDYVQSEAWKIENENIALPQDLFPTPIKIQHQEQLWTFFQPINTHQLATWGQTVRNCVGSATSYAEGVKKKRHFIVLGMLDNAPRFTIQLKVDNGVMHVVQITDLCNTRLDQEQQANYTTVFKMALDKRAQELVTPGGEKEEVIAKQ